MPVVSVPSPTPKTSTNMHFFASLLLMIQSWFVHAPPLQPAIQPIPVSPGINKATITIPKTAPKTIPVVKAKSTLPIKKFSGTQETTFAEVINGTVTRVIVADQAFIDSGAVGDPANWVQTYEDGSIGKNYAGVGYTYDSKTSSFISPKPDQTATLDSNTGKWSEPKTTFVQATATPL